MDKPSPQSEQRIAQRRTGNVECLGKRALLHDGVGPQLSEHDHVEQAAIGGDREGCGRSIQVRVRRLIRISHRPF